MNQTPIKNGALVYLTGDSLLVRGDLYAYYDGSGLQLAIHYVTPFQSVPPVDPAEGYPDTWDAIFDTAVAGAACVDIEAARVMIASPKYCSVTNAIAEMIPEFNRQSNAAMMLEMLRSAGIDFQVINLDGTEENKGPLQ